MSTTNHAARALSPSAGAGQKGRIGERLRQIGKRLASSPLARRLLEGSFWLVVGALCGRCATLLSSIFAARMLGKEGFGEFGIIQGAVWSFGLFAGFGLGITANKHVAEFRLTDPGRAGRILALSRRTAFVTGGITAGLVSLFAGALASSVMGNARLAPEIRIASLSLFLGAVNGAQLGALSGFEAFRSQARINFLGGVIGCFLMVGGVYFSGLPGAVWAMVGTGAAVCWISERALREQAREHAIDLQPAGVLNEWQVLTRFSVPAVLSGLSVVPVNWACNLILVNQPQGYSEMGVLNAAIQWRNVILFIPGIMMSVALPMFTSLAAMGEHRKRHAVFVSNVVIGGVLAFGLAAVIALFSSLIMKSYGSGFEMGQRVLVLQAFAAAIASIVGLLGQFMVSNGQMWWIIALQLVWASINLGLTWLLRHRGAEGVAIAYLAAYLVHLVTMSGMTLRQMNRSPAKANNVAPDAGIVSPL